MVAWFKGVKVVVRPDVYRDLAGKGSKKSVIGTVFDWDISRSPGDLSGVRIGIAALGDRVHGGSVRLGSGLSHGESSSRVVQGPKLHSIRMFQIPAAIPP